MSILIKGMEMPTSCCQCPVNMEVCKRGYKYLLAHSELYDKRADDCPLVPVPPHGRLGDLDVLRARIARIDTGYSWDSYGNGQYDAFQDVYRRIDAAPTIIPAEEGE